MPVSSIFNDVIGPVMRGPSSSHSAAACRLGLLLSDLMQGKITDVVIDYDPNGSLVTTHESQGTDMGLYGGLMGWQADDPRMTDYRVHLEASGIRVKVNYLDYGAQHPNNYRIAISNNNITHTVEAISTGGGMMEIWEIDGSRVSIAGDCYVILIYGSDLPTIFGQLPLTTGAQTALHESFIEIRIYQTPEPGLLDQLNSLPGVKKVCHLKPVLPVLASEMIEVPFTTCSEMTRLGKDENLALWELALRYEAIRGNLTEEEVFAKMHEILKIMRSAVSEGLAGTNFDDRILPAQAPGFAEKMVNNDLLDGGMLNRIILYTTAMMEVKSSMGVFVAAPTAGSCGTLPGALLGAGDALQLPDEAVVKALLAAGIMGVFIAEHATFAAEVAGCQAETGAGGSMAAAGLVTLMNGRLEQCITASSLALQNSLGIVCDPIGNRVEAPCLGKNVMAASNALSCANMALANYEQLIPFDEVVQSMMEVGEMMAHELTCTGLGGLAATPTGRAIEEKLRQKAKYC